MRRGIVNSRVGLGREQAGVFRVGADSGKAVYRIGSGSQGNRQFGIWNPYERSSCGGNIYPVTASRCRSRIYPVRSVPRDSLPDCRGRNDDVGKLVESHRNQASRDVLYFRFQCGRVNLQRNVVNASEHAEFVVSVYRAGVRSPGSGNLRYDWSGGVSFDVRIANGVGSRVVEDVVERIREVYRGVRYGNGGLADENGSSPYGYVESSERFDVERGGNVGLEEVEDFSDVVHFDRGTGKVLVRVRAVDSLDRERRTGTGIEHPLAFRAVTWVENDETLGMAGSRRSYRNGKAHVPGRRDVGRGERVVEILDIDVPGSSRHGYFTL